MGPVEIDIQKLMSAAHRTRARTLHVCEYSFLWNNVAKIIVKEQKSSYNNNKYSTFAVCDQHPPQYVRPDIMYMYMM